MAREIERKYLLTDASWRTSVTGSMLIRQGYLTTLTGGARASVRVRITDTDAFLNIKSMTIGIARDEFEYPIPLDDAQHMLDHLCSGAVIDKWRHHVHFGGLLWEIDEFLGANAGLVVAEVELDSTDQTVPLPSWVGAEVSDDARYYNVALVQTPYTQWKDA
ncbi:CYTH domain-containing protein [Halothiobacillus sp.]|jgi:adenylate cyclase|uniref:CYTH domain-containing protein n=1 Tax=Halothiobacillus sp. TaxID=1891311 RepID=UPI002AD1EA83|nr:CYTH domain-containing protein [Halothiobacillus sp.]